MITNIYNALYLFYLLKAFSVKCAISLYTVQFLKHTRSKHLHAPSIIRHKGYLTCGFHLNKYLIFETNIYITPFLDWCRGTYWSWSEVIRHRHGCVNPGCIIKSLSVNYDIQRNSIIASLHLVLMKTMDIYINNICL